VNGGHWLAVQGVQVLIIDLDVQGHIASCLGMAKGPDLFRWLVGENPAWEAMLVARQALTPALSQRGEGGRQGEGGREGEGKIKGVLSVIRSDKSTEKVKTYLADMAFRELYLGRKLEELRKEMPDLDVIILDLSPGSDLLHVGALIASDYVIIPAKLDYLALDGVVEMIKTISSLANLANVEAPVILGVLPTMFDRSTIETVSNLRRLRDTVGAEMVLPPIPMDTHTREATSRGLTIWEYAPGTPAAVGYRALGGHGKNGLNSMGLFGGYLHLGEMVMGLIGG
jgi:cellulose biosynthesis protein BcsQ